MTTTIKVTSCNFPARVQYVDGGQAPVTRQVLFPADGEQTFYCTTTREVRITDLEYDDPEALAWTPTPLPVAPTPVADATETAAPSSPDASTDDPPTADAAPAVDAVASGS